MATYTYLTLSQLDNNLAAAGYTDAAVTNAINAFLTPILPSSNPAPNSETETPVPGGSSNQVGYSTVYSSVNSSYWPGVHVGGQASAEPTVWDLAGHLGSSSSPNFLDGGVPDGPVAVVVNTDPTNGAYITIGNNPAAGYNVLSPHIIALNGGADTIDMGQSGATAVDTVFAGGGADSIMVGPGHATVYGQAGGDTIQLIAGTNLAFGDDSVTLAAGQGGSNLIAAYAGTNTIFGGDGNDTLAMFGGQNTVFGVSYGDTTKASSGEVYVLGYDPRVTYTPPQDTSSSAVSNVIYDGAGSNVFDLNSGSNTVYLGGGTDTVDVINGKNVIHVDGAGPVTMVAGGNVFNDTASSSANVAQNNFNVYGGQNTIYGGSGATSELYQVRGGSSLDYIGSTAPGSTGHDVVTLRDTFSGAATLSAGTSAKEFDVLGTPGSLSIQASGTTNDSMNLFGIDAGTVSGSYNTTTGTYTFTFGTGQSATIGNAKDQNINFGGAHAYNGDLFSATGNTGGADGNTLVTSPHLTKTP